MKCYACDRKLGSNPYVVDTRDDQFVYVGSECFKFIKRAGEAGYQPPSGGPKLYLIARGLPADKLDEIHVSARSYHKSTK